MAENIKGSDILETFIKTGLHRTAVFNEENRWPHETIVVCLIDFSDNTKDFVIKKNDSQFDKHAEEILIEDINDKLKIKQDEGLTKIKSITIYSNNSPCTRCSVQLLEKKFPADLRIKFSSLYNIKRPSCARSTTCSCHYVLDKKDAETMTPREAKMKHSERFRNLMKLDAWPFQKKDWDAFIELLQENDARKENDTSDLDGLRYGKKYGDWRNGEDTKMMADYKELSREMSQSTPKNTISTDKPSRPSKGDQATGGTGDEKARRKLFHQSEKQ